MKDVRPTSPEWQAYLHISVICIVCVATIISYGSYRCSTTEFSDPLTIAFASPPFDQFLDGWGMTHFCFYTMLAYLYPRRQHLIYTWMLGLGWEVTESIFKEHPFYLSECNYKIESAQGGGWWYGRWQDLVMNALGLAFGRLLWQHAHWGGGAMTSSTGKQTSSALRNALGAYSTRALASNSRHSGAQQSLKR